MIDVNKYVRVCNKYHWWVQDLSVGNDDVVDVGNPCNPVHGKGRNHAVPKKKIRVT